jgi:hypothetical protein
MIPTLFELTGQYRELMAMSDEVPPEQLQDSLDLIAGDIKDKCTNIGFVVTSLETMADAMEEAAKRMLARAKSTRNRSLWLMEYARRNMEAAGITRIESPELVVRIQQNPPRAVIDDEGALPARFLRMPPPAPPPQPQPDRKAILEALKAGEQVAGAHIEQSSRLVIR